MTLLTLFDSHQHILSRFGQNIKGDAFILKNQSISGVVFL